MLQRKGIELILAEHDPIVNQKSPRYLAERIADQVDKNPELNAGDVLGIILELGGSDPGNDALEIQKRVFNGEDVNQVFLELSGLREPQDPNFLTPAERATIFLSEQLIAISEIQRTVLKPRGIRLDFVVEHGNNAEYRLLTRLKLQQYRNSLEEQLNAFEHNDFAVAKKEFESRILSFSIFNVLRDINNLGLITESLARGSKFVFSQFGISHKFLAQLLSVASKEKGFTFEMIKKTEGDTYTPDTTSIAIWDMESKILLEMEKRGWKHLGSRELFEIAPLLELDENLVNNGLLEDYILWILGETDENQTKNLVYGKENEGYEWARDYLKSKFTSELKVEEKLSMLQKEKEEIRRKFITRS